MAVLLVQHLLYAKGTSRTVPAQVGRAGTVVAG
jgi:hypothetical protein